MSTLNKINYFLIIFLLTFYSRIALSQDIPNVLTGQILTGQNPMESVRQSFVQNYMGLSSVGTYLISLFVAIALAMVIAFHPQTFGKKEDLSEIEAPKSLIFYAMIGSLIGATVADYGPELGFIFFGLGGLMRFRTNTGTSVQTGRLILVALIGLCCGLKMLYIATISTIVGWVLIYFLERRTIYQIEIKGINSKVFPESVEIYRHTLKRLKCNILMEKKNTSKSKINFIFSSPAKLHRDNLEQLLDEQIPTNNQGSIDWSVGYK